MSGKASYTRLNPWRKRKSCINVFIQLCRLTTMQNREHQISTMENINNFSDYLVKFATLYHWVTCYTQYLRKMTKLFLKLVASYDIQLNFQQIINRHLLSYFKQGWAFTWDICSGVIITASLRDFSKSHILWAARSEESSSTITVAYN